MFFFLSRFDTGTCHHLFEVSVRQFTVIGHTPYPEVDITADSIGEFFFYQPPDNWFCLGSTDLSQRPCLETRVDICRGG